MTMIIKSAALFLAMMMGSTSLLFSADRFANIEVDASQAVGSLKALRGVHGSPLRPSRQTPTDPPTDISEGYREARVNMIRTHDSQGAGDLDPGTGNLPPLIPPSEDGSDPRQAQDANAIFPDLDADADSPDSYNFGPSDKLIEAIRGVGAEVLFRLGRRGMTTAEPPTDLDKYGEIIRHVVLHYNKGWANGFHYNIRYWEVWNEPDLGRIWWTGTPEQYYRLYEAAAKAVKDADPTAMIGGPCIAFVNEPTPYREGFLAYVRDRHLPLDFFTWHYYSVDADDPYDFVRIGRSMRALLDSYGFLKTQNILGEWNAGIEAMHNAEPTRLASFAVSSLIYLQDGDIDQALYYRADRAFEDHGAPNKIGQGLIAIGRMADTPVRLSVSGGGTNGFAVQAGRSESGDRVQVLISNYEIPKECIGPRKGEDVWKEPNLFDLKLLPRRSVSYDANGGYNMLIKGLEPDSDYKVERYRMTKEQDFSLVEESRMKGGQVRLNTKLPSPAVELVVITRHQPDGA